MHRNIIPFSSITIWIFIYTTLVFYVLTYLVCFKYSHTSALGKLLKKSPPPSPENWKLYFHSQYISNKIIWDIYGISLGHWHNIWHGFIYQSHYLYILNNSPDIWEAIGFWPLTVQHGCKSQCILAGAPCDWGPCLGHWFARCCKTGKCFYAWLYVYQ